MKCLLNGFLNRTTEVSLGPERVSGPQCYEMDAPLGVGGGRGWCAAQCTSPQALA